MRGTLCTVHFHKQMHEILKWTDWLYLKKKNKKNIIGEISKVLDKTRRLG